MRADPRLRVRVELVGGPRLMRMLRRISRGIEATLLPRRNRRRRSSILCKVGIHDWEAWELSTQGLRFAKRCRRRGCSASRAYKTAALGPTEPISVETVVEAFAPAKLKRGGSDG